MNVCTRFIFITRVRNVVHFTIRIIFIQYTMYNIKLRILGVFVKITKEQPQNKGTSSIILNVTKEKRNKGKKKERKNGTTVRTVHWKDAREDAF